MPIFLVPLIALVLIFAIWLVSLIWGKPLTVNGLFTRTFFGLAFRNPEILTQLGILENFGIHGHNRKFADFSEKAQDREMAISKKDLAILRSYKKEGKSEQTRMSMDIAEYFLDDNIQSDRFRYHSYLFKQAFGVHSGMPDFMTTTHPVTGRVEAHNYIIRLSKFGKLFEQLLDHVRKQEEKGIIPPRFVIAHVIKEMKEFTEKAPEANPLYSVFSEKLGKLPRIGKKAKERFLLGAKSEILNTVYPIYKKIIDYFTELEKKADSNDGVWKHPDGEAYYKHRLRSNTTSDYSPDEVHEMGLKEVERIEAQMRQILEREGHNIEESPTATLAKLGQEERFLYPETDAGRTECIKDIQKILDDMNLAIEPYFSKKPKSGLVVERIPEFTEKTAPGAYYQPGTIDGKRPGKFFINLRSMKELPKFGLKTLVYHEGIPGHHFQLAIAQELKGLPFFRRMALFSAYAEGWAMYTEELAREMGMYKDDPYGELGSLDSELFRAVRLVVDTGIHAKRWSREKAIEYMKAHSAQDMDSIITEIERYIVMPGQACAYKIGMIKMLELRAKAMEALGESFDIKEFHDLVLNSGALPLSLLERQVDSYIEKA